MASYDPRFGFDPVTAFLGDREQRVSSTPPRPDVTLSSVPRSIAGLCRLSRSCAWAAVLDLSTSLLTEHDDILDDVPDHQLDPAIFGDRQAPAARALLPHERLECVAYRALALLQTRQLGRAADTISQLGDLSPDRTEHTYESFPEAYPISDGRRGSFVPFALRALAGEIRLRSDPSAIEELYALRRDCARYAEEAEDETGEALWRAREGQTLSAIAAGHMRAARHDAAVDVARSLAEQQGSTARSLYMYARVLLHVGDLDCARDVLKLADACADAPPGLRMVHEGLSFAAEGKLREAAGVYAAAAMICKEGDREMQSVWAFAENNRAICLLHQGMLNEAVDVLETCLRDNPPVALDEGIITNVVTLYDLAFPDKAAEKRGVVRALASKYGRQGFDLSVTSSE